MVKYKREEYLSDSKHRALVISGLLWGCASVDALRVYFKIQGEIDHKGLLLPAVLFAALSAFLLLKGLLGAEARRKDAMESRRNFLESRVVSHGKVTAAGGGYYQ